MLGNYIKTALRHLLKQKQYSLINIIGLGVGMACALLILLFVQEEMSFDRFHANRNRIYRVNLATTHPHSTIESVRAIGPFRLADELAIDFPDLSHIVRFAPQERELVRVGDTRFIEEGLVFVDPAVFSVFTIPLRRGDPETALAEPFSVVITDAMAEKYFGDVEPIGKALHFRDHDFKVTGILDAPPGNSQYAADMLASMYAAEQVFSRIVLENWGEGSCETFLLLPEGTSPVDFTARLTAFVEVKLESWKVFSPRLELQPLSRVHLYSQHIAAFAPGGDATFIYAFSAIAIFILFIACINFMNLATARSANRAREVGLRKVVGARRTQLIGQFMSESMVLTLLALALSLVLAMVSLPLFNNLAGKNLSIDLFGNSALLFGLTGIALFVGLVSGSYPALFLSAFKPISVLNGPLRSGMNAGTVRKTLVTVQFAISIFLIVVTAAVYQQLNYARSTKLGFDKERLVLLEGTPESMRSKYEAFGAALLRHPDITHAAASSRVPPGRLRSSLQTRPEGIPEDQREGMQTVWTDFDFVGTMGFELAAGRSFSRNFATDANRAFMLNEAAVRKIGWTNTSAIGRAFGSSEIKDWESGQWEQRDGQVIGVLRDFHFESLHQEIVPTVYFVAPYMAWNYVIRIGPGDVREALQYIEKQWVTFNPELPFQYTLVDDNFAALYRTEETQGKIFAVFALLGIFIACLGLIGLASFSAEQKTREIGIRKILGATTGRLVLLLSREFTWLVLLAFAVAGPLAWYVMQHWLQSFAYHISLGAGIFLAAGLLALILAWATVSFHVVKAALANPADALRYE